MAQIEIKSPTVKVKYIGKDDRPNGLLVGGVPEKGKTYEVRRSLWEVKDTKDWQEVNAESKKSKAPKKNPSKASK